MRIVRILLFLAILLSSAGNGFSQAPGNARHYGNIAWRVSQYLPREHLSRHRLDDDISGRAWTNYLSSAISGLDFDHMYFLQSDIDKFREQVYSLDNMLCRGDLSFAYKVFDVFKARVKDRQEYVSELIEKGFDLNKEDVYEFRDKNSSWPASREEWNELWRKRIKNDFVRIQVAAELASMKKEKKEGDIEEQEDVPDVGSIAEDYKRYLTVIEDSGDEWVLERFLTSFTSAYDPHSGYMAPSSVEDFNIQMRLSLMGIGALLQMDGGAAKVVRIIPGGPADQDKSESRLRPGDKIVAVAQGDDKGEDIRHWPLPRIVRLIRGERGTKVVLTVVSASDPAGTTTRKVPLIRGEVRLEEQAARDEVRKVDCAGEKKTIAIVELPAFYGNMQVQDPEDPEFKSCAHDVEKILRKLQADESVDGLILDLRSNGGGSLLEAIRLTGLFIKTGPVVQVQERFGPRSLSDKDPAVIYTGPMIVLVNRLSASASEIVAGALQDYHRAIIVGDKKTHGKGTVQSIIELGDVSMGVLKLTTSAYYRISGQSAQLKGVSSDIVLPSPFNTMELGEEELPYALKCKPVDPVSYIAAKQRQGLVNELTERSRKRRAADEKFKSYTKLLERLETLNKIKSLPLNLDDRIRWAKTEKELTSLRDKVMGAGDDDVEEEDAPDPVMDESVRIMADMIMLENGSDSQVPPSRAAKKGLADSVLEWLKGVL